MKQFLIFLLSSFSIIVSAKDTVIDIHVVKPPQNSEIVIQNEKVFQVVEQMPDYPGGYDAMTNFITTNLRYPDSLRSQNIGGRVIVGVVIETDGSLSDIVIKKSVNPVLDAEALRVIRLLPKFKPGKQLGKPVKVAFVLPVQFGMPDKLTGPTAQPYDPRKRGQ